MAERTAKVQRKGFRLTKNRALALVLILLLIATILMTALYRHAAVDSKVVDRMQIYALSGSSNQLSVDDLLLLYNGAEYRLVNGTFRYLGEAGQDKSAFTYRLYLQEKNSDTKTVLLSNSSLDATMDLTKPVALSVTDGNASGIDFKKFTEEYQVGFQLDVTTPQGVQSEDIFLKVNPIDSSFFQNVDFDAAKAAAQQ